MSDTTVKLGPVRLAPGVTAVHASCYLFAALLGVTVTTFLSTFMPNILEVNLGLATDQQGRIASYALFGGEIVLLLTSSLVGAYSDKVGRRPVLIAGLLWLAAGYVVLAYVDSVVTLITVRVVLSFGVSIIAVIVAALMVDYPANDSRGKMSAFAGVAIGLGNLFSALGLMALPNLLVTRYGFAELAANRFTLFVMAGLSVFLAIVVRIWLKGGRPPKVEEHETMRQKLIVGVKVAREQSRVFLAYLCAFVARADLVVVGTFFSLWLTQYGISIGLSPSAAAAEMGKMFALVMLSALLWAPVIGWLIDRMDRAMAMALSMLLAAIGYIVVVFVPDPLGGWMIPAGIMLGIGQMSAVTASQALIGQESPSEYRGAVVGMFSVFGAAGILFVSGVGGFIFDLIAPTAPFVLISILNGLLFLAAYRIAKTTTARPSD